MATGDLLTTAHDLRRGEDLDRVIRDEIVRRVRVVEWDPPKRMAAQIVMRPDTYLIWRNWASGRCQILGIDVIVSRIEADWKLILDVENP